MVQDAVRQFAAPDAIESLPENTEPVDLLSSPETSRGLVTRKVFPEAWLWSNMTAA